MSSPSSTRSTPSRRSSRLSGRNSEAREDVTMDQDLPESSAPEGANEPFSDLAQPLPPESSPASGTGRQATSSGRAPPTAPMERGQGPSTVGPGSVLVSEFDLSSPLQYGTPSSVESANVPRTPKSSKIRGPNGTPIRIRSDIQSPRRLRQVNVTPGGGRIGPSSQASGVEGSQIPSEVIPPSEASDSAPHFVIWGTDVSVETCKKKFKDFLSSFEAFETEEGDSGGRISVYMRELLKIDFVESPFLNVDCAHLNEFDRELYRQLVCYPQEVIPILDMAANELFFERKPQAVLTHQIQVRPFNAEKTRNMRALNPEDLDLLITITGMVIRTSSIIPEMREAFFQCSVCKFTATVDVERGRIAEPTLCTNCNTNHSFVLIHNRSAFHDKQMIKLQESPDDMPSGETPHTVVLYAHGKLVDCVQPGDRVAVTGIYRAVPVRVNPKMRTIKSIFKTHIDVVHFHHGDTHRLKDEENDEKRKQEFSPERVELLKELSRKEDVYERLARAIAPSIYENEDIKKGILLQLLGGSKKCFASTGRRNFRSEINILLCGDPGTSKSQLLRYVFNLIPRSQYTSGKGSSAVGLTAYVTKDPESRQLVLQPGALVLADKGICCIDEFDKMNDSTRSILHEVMEQQTLSIAKAGIICQLNARTSVLAAANPIGSQWNNQKTIVENIQLPHTLMSRFDLIFLMLDPQDEAFDKRLGRHLVSLYHRSSEDEAEETMDMGILRDYIAYAKENYNPKLTDNAGEHLIEAYCTMRQVGNRHGRVTAYPRQLESLIRLAEAHAKMRLSEEVELIDVEEAIRLHQEALKQSATDPKSGTINLDILSTGPTEGNRMFKKKPFVPPQ